MLFSPMADPMMGSVDIKRRSSKFKGIVLPSPRGMPGELPKESAEKYIEFGRLGSLSKMLMVLPIVGEP